MSRQRVFGALVAAAVAAATTLAGGTAAADDEKVAGKVYEPKDSKAFPVTDKDVVRFTGPAPGSTGYKTTVAVTAGDAKVVTRAVYVVADGKAGGPGSGALEFDVFPVPGKAGPVTVVVTKTPPGKEKGESKEYHFVVK